MKNIILIVILCLSSLSVYAQTNDLPERKAYTLQLKVNDSSYFQSDIQSSPYVMPENTIQIYPGETIYIETELEGKKIKSMKSVKENNNPEKTITIKMTQIADSLVHKNILFEISNPFGYPLEYKAMMFLINRDEWIPTDVVAVQPQLSAMEMWPDIIVSLALTGWEFK
jgi:hypothetical protein